jgi:hypothetical protein
MTCPVCGPPPAKRNKRRKARDRQRGPAVTWDGVAAAVGLLTARHLGTGDSQAEVLGDVPPEAVIGALEILAGVLLRQLRCADTGAPVTAESITALLRDLGLAALEEASR